jgi:hypothetical protein
MRKRIIPNLRAEFQLFEFLSEVAIGVARKAEGAATAKRQIYDLIKTYCEGGAGCYYQGGIGCYC